jgi:Peptidase family C25
MDGPSLPTATPGSIRIVAFNTTPLSGSGTLIKINFNVVGAGGAATPLTWTNFTFNEGDPAASPLTNGNYTVTGPTAVKLEKFAATGYDGGVYLEWKTGLEADNLGFNVYRESGGQKELVNSETVAGSALLTGQTRLQTGRTYSWWDKGIADCGSPSADCKNAQYWLEDIDLNGQSNWHGPVSPSLVGGTPPAQSDAAVLSRIGSTQTPHLSTPFERRASARMSSGQAAIQPVPAGTSAVKVSVRREDWYSLSSTELVAAGFNSKPDPDRLQMYVDGEQIPISVITDDKKQLSAIEFYGTGLDAAYTDARVYLIVEGTEKGLRIEQVNADVHPSSAHSFSYSVERRDRTIYFSGLRNGERENFFGSVVGREAIVQSLTLQHLDRSTTNQVQVEVSLQGVTTLPHRVWVNVNGSFVGEVMFNGQELKGASFSLPPSLLREGNNEVQLVARGGPSDISLIDYVRLSYPRTFMAESDQLRFEATAGAAVTVDGFSSAAIRVFDVTNQDRVQQLVGKIEQGKNGYAITVAPSEKGERTLLAIAGQTTAAQARVSASVASDLRGNNHAANLLIITNRDFFAALEPLKKLRTSQGYKVEMVDVEAIYDQFSFGNKSPYAVKEFLQYARANWKIAPQYVLLAGDASYDPKNYLGFGDWDIVPTKLIDTGLMETASDDWFADFNQDGVPEMSVGRLPVRSKEEAENMVARIVRYEQSSGAGEITLVADANDGYDFEAATAQLRALVPGDIRVVEIDRGRMGTEAKAALIDAINRGQNIVNYTGHGNVAQWRADLLTNADAALLTNQNHLAVFVMMTCLNGYFDDPALSSLAEALMKTGSGGAVAVWASSGMTTADEQALMNREFYRQLFANRGIALGEAIKRAKGAVGDGDVRRTWILLGDPTMRVK